MNVSTLYKSVKKSKYYKFQENIKYLAKSCASVNGNVLIRNKHLVLTKRQRTKV